MTQLAVPDISTYRAGAGGVEFVSSFEGPRPGPHAAIVALMHGNELCGVHALAFLLREGVRPARGKLSLVFANVAAFQAYDALQPAESRYLDEDMNRVWSAAALDGPRQSRELARARQLRPLFDTVDCLLDIHSMQTPSPPLALCGALAKGRALAATVGFPANVVVDAGHVGGTRLRDYSAFADAASPRAALLVECGQHLDDAARPVAIEASVRFLAAAGVIEPEVAQGYFPAPPPRQRVIEVTEAISAASREFRFVADYAGLEVVAKAGTAIASDGARTIRTPYDDCVLVMPSPRVAVGLTAVRFGRYL
jgi:predicted deacylase